MIQSRTPTTNSRTGSLTIAASPVKGVAAGGTLPVELGNVKFEVKAGRTPPAASQSFRPNVATTVEFVSGILRMGLRRRGQVRDDLRSSSALLQLPSSQLSTAERNVGFRQMQVKSFTLLQFAFAALEYIQVC